MAYAMKAKQQPPKDTHLERNYGVLGCNAILAAASMTNRRDQQPVSKGYASQTGKKQR